MSIVSVRLAKSFGVTDASFTCTFVVDELDFIALTQTSTSLCDQVLLIFFHADSITVSYPFTKRL